jgi:hypothetical protein
MWDGQRRDGATNSTLRIKEQEKRLTLNEHDDEVKIKQSRNRSGVAQRVPGGLGSQFS